MGQFIQQTQPMIKMRGDMFGNRMGHVGKQDFLQVDRRLVGLALHDDAHQKRGRQNRQRNQRDIQRAD